MPTTVAASDIEPYLHAINFKRVDHGIVKFPVNIHGIWIERNPISCQVILKAHQNDVSLQFILDDDGCQHLAKLLMGEI
jgi:hypothetical protein